MSASLDGWVVPDAGGWVCVGWARLVAKQFAVAAVTTRAVPLLPIVNASFRRPTGRLL